jgi:beta-galactosidase
MKNISLRLAMIVLITLTSALHFDVLAASTTNRDRSFDSDWRFLRADAPGAESPVFNDSAWRTLDLPHDWSIEDLPSTNGAPPSPFDPAQSGGGASTGFFVGGTGWYRKHFTLNPVDAGKNVTILFDGVYMNADFWINGQRLGNHPYGYTAFSYNLTPHLKPAGQENVLAVQVKNTGKNSRWYSGSGIYRNVSLVVADPVHIPVWGLHVIATNTSKSDATVSVATTITNGSGVDATIRVRTRLVQPNGRALRAQEEEISIPAGNQRELTQVVPVNRPILWSLENPALYRAEVELIQGRRTLDRTATPFGIRSLRFTPSNGFELNGEVVELKGGCMHHDNGPLGSAAIDRAEERRVELMKAYGFNAIRTAHNPPSRAFLDACDRLGMLVIDEAFDMWERQKNPDDYHLYFKDWWQRDLESMILRDRNHPSVIMWSIGNEIPERGAPSGVAIADKMAAAIRPLDTTRPVTAGICEFWDDRSKTWADTAPAFVHLEADGYNYQWRRYVSDHATFPARIMYGAESYPREAFDNWRVVVSNSWVIGDFVWTAWDYIGETGLGNAVLDNERANRFPWFNAFCGDIDICGFKKAPLYYREVIWGDAQVNLAVHAPIPQGRRERVSQWGWPDERQSWTWPGSEGTPLDVTVYSSCETVRLELDGKEIATEPVNARMIARFKVPYQPGELRAIGLSGGKRIASASLRTAGEPSNIRLTADRSKVRANRNDLSYVTVEIIDRNGTLVPNAAIPVRFTVTGAGELAATGSGAPNDAASFHLPVRKAWQGRCLAILRPKGNSGRITLKAEADGLKPATLVVITR